MQLRQEYRRFTPQETSYIEECYKVGTPTALIATRLGRTVGSVIGHAGRHGFKHAKGDQQRRAAKTRAADRAILGYAPTAPSTPKISLAPLNF